MSDFGISLEQATSWIKSWNNDIPKEPAKAHLMEKQALLDVMQPDDVVSVRAYLGTDDDGVQKLIFVGVDVNGNDLIDENHFIVDRSKPCPPHCVGDESPLLTHK